MSAYFFDFGVGSFSVNAPLQGNLYFSAFPIKKKTYTFSTKINFYCNTFSSFSTIVIKN